MKFRGFQGVGKELKIKKAGYSKRKSRASILRQAQHSGRTVLNVAENGSSSVLSLPDYRRTVFLKTKATLNQRSKHIRNHQFSGCLRAADNAGYACAGVRSCADKIHVFDVIIAVMCAEIGAL